MCTSKVVSYTAVEKEWSTKENQSELQQNHDASLGAAAVGEKACLGMRQC